MVPVNIRVGESTPNGYRAKDFEDVFSRHLSPDSNPKRSDGTTAGGVGENDDFVSGTNGECPGSKNGTSAYSESGCAATPDENAKKGAVGRKNAQFGRPQVLELRAPA